MMDRTKSVWKLTCKITASELPKPNLLSLVYDSHKISTTLSFHSNYQKEKEI